MTPPYLSNFEQIHHEAIRLAGYKMNEICNMDEEYIINVLCAFVAVAYNKIQKYAEKYFGGFSNKINLFYNKLVMGRYDFVSGNISINPDIIFYEEDVFDEVLLHELTHSIYHDHRIEFWQHLQHLLYLEGLIKEEKEFRISEQSGSRAVYYGERKIGNNDQRIMMHFVENSGSDRYDNIEKLFRRVFYYQDIMRYRKTGTSSYLIDDNNNFISMEPIWRKYALRYNIEPIFLLQMSCMDEDRMRRNSVNVNNYETFKPIQAHDTLQ